MIDEIFKEINKQFKKELAIKGIKELTLKKIPFSSPRLNYETYGGIPRGRVSMFAGKESSGKTTTALDILKNAQVIFFNEWSDQIHKLEDELKSGKLSKPEEKDRTDKLNFLMKRGPQKTVYFDAEGTIDPDWAAKLGVDTDNVYLVRLHTQTAEQFLDQVMKVVKDPDDSVGLVIIDSIAVLVPQLVHGVSFEQKNMGGNSKVVTDFCNEVCPILGEKDIACIIINQARDDFKNPYAEFAIPCGNALKLASTIILTFQKGKPLDAQGKEQTKSFDSPKGNLFWVRVQKTKIFKPDRRVGFYSLNYDYGIDTVKDILDLAVDIYGFIKKAGSWFTLCHPVTGEILVDTDDKPLKFQGEAQVATFLRSNEELYNLYYNYINDDVCGLTDNQHDLTIDGRTDLEAIQSSNEVDVLPNLNSIGENNYELES